MKKNIKVSGIIDVGMLILFVVFLLYLSLFTGIVVLKEKIVCKIGNLGQAYICQWDSAGDMREIDILVYALPLFILLCIWLFFTLRKYKIIKKKY